MKRKILISALATALLLACFTGCGDDKEKDPAVTTGSTTGSIVQPDVKSEEEIKKTYMLSADDAAALAGENTTEPITMGGFTFKCFETPILTEGRPLVSATPIYSADGIKKYVEENSHLYDLDHGTESFSAACTKYSEEFFLEKAVLIVSFRDDNGGDGYDLKGAWEGVLQIEDLEMDQLSLALKKTAGTKTAGHLLIELDAEYVAVWDSITMQIYE